MTNTMKGDLLDVGQNIVEAGVDEGALGVDGIVATFAASWRDSNCTIRAGDYRNRRAINIEAMEIKMEVFLEFILPATMASDSASRARAALASSSAA